ncbi:MAG: hypothetical protein LJE84_05590 [Gammaproteobacteria bacterium]|nr:hypothetical protein [Gammaproteobacteria bacterium]
MLGSIELLSALAYFGIFGEGFSYRLLHQRLERQITPEAAGITRPTGQMVIHPCLGFVFNPEAVDKTVRTALGGLEISRFGFVDTAPLLAPRSATGYRIAVLGGSVAAAFGILGRARLIERLQALPQLTNRRVELINLGMAGYKQPQTALTLMWVLSLGAEFDAVINIDGFNDIALPEADNVRLGVMAAYPREWANLAPGVASLRRQTTLASIALTRQGRRDAASLVNRFPLRYSASALVLWSVYDRSRAARLGGLQRELGQERGSARSRYQVSGGFRPYASREAMYDDFVALWQRGSRLLHQVCQANGMRYFHFL